MAKISHSRGSERRGIQWNKNAFFKVENPNKVPAVEIAISRRILKSNERGQLKIMQDS